MKTKRNFNKHKKYQNWRYHKAFGFVNLPRKSHLPMISRLMGLTEIMRAAAAVVKIISGIMKVALYIDEYIKISFAPPKRSRISVPKDDTDSWLKNQLA